MSFDHNHDLPPLRTSWQRASKFRDRLSQITITPPDAPPVEKSKFSPDSPPAAVPRPSTSHNRMASSSTAHMYKNPRSLEAGVRQLESPKPRGVMSRINAFLRDIWKDDEPEMVPIQQPSHLGPWPPLHVEKRPQAACHCQDPKRKKRRRLWIIVLIIVLLYLLANTVALNVRVLTLPSESTPNTSNTPSPTPNSSSQPFTLSTDQRQCLTQFTVNAPGNPSSYPCSSCLPLLSVVPAGFATADAQDAQNVQNAVQFCGLKSVFDSANTQGQQSLAGGNWVKDVKFCAWSGVSCDGAGMVASMQLTFPAVPASIPTEFGSLTGLQNLQIVGNGQIPGGSLPGSFANLTSMTTLHVESTGMNALPDNLFSTLTKLMSLTLVKNNNFGGGLPSTISGLSLQSLVINSQTLSTTLSNLLSSSALQKSLQLLDLSSTGLSTSIPAAIGSFTALTELHLDGNNLQPPLPAGFPPVLQILTLSNNTALSGTLPAALCASTQLKTCTLRGTGLGGGGACGLCTFS